MTNLARLHGGPERATVGYKLTVTYTSGYADAGTCETFEDLSQAIDAAMAAPGFVSDVDGRLMPVGGPMVTNYPGVALVSVDPQRERAMRARYAQPPAGATMEPA